MDEDTCLLQEWSQCCCQCRYHHQDFYHCTTKPRPLDEDGAELPNCVCNIPKGWICMNPEIGRACSNWSKHGLCETFEKKQIDAPQGGQEGTP
jgi:hypothetical protein